jgi:thioredoxin 1
MAEYDLLVINFYAAWCAPCRRFREDFTEAAKENSDAVFAMVDVDKQRDLGTAFQVEAVPKLAVLRSGALVFAHEGTLSLDALNDVIRQVRELDVGELRRAAAASASKKADLPDHGLDASQ